MKALIFVRLDAWEEVQACRLLQRTPHLMCLERLYGDYQAVLHIEFANLEQLKKVIRECILPLPGVKEVLSCLIAEPYPAFQDREAILIPATVSERGVP